ncbi:hypothetical protein RI367_002447 [Sorochytrium milnesiophthora]
MKQLAPAPAAFSDKTAFYKHLAQQAAALCEGQRNWVTNTANVASLVYHELRALTGRPYNWVGFYVRDTQHTDKETLILGPFQGKIACTEIAFGKGVCGTAAATRQSQLVADVNTFPGHIACDSASRSEVVVPIEATGASGERVVVGVFDLDCEVEGGFDETDRQGLEHLVSTVLTPACDWSQLLP